MNDSDKVIISDEAYGEARRAYGSWDILELEQAWRNMLAEINTVPKNPDGSFVAYAKKCAENPGYLPSSIPPEGPISAGHLFKNIANSPIESPINRPVIKEKLWSVDATPAQIARLAARYDYLSPRPPESPIASETSAKSSSPPANPNETPRTPEERKAMADQLRELKEELKQLKQHRIDKKTPF